MCITRYSGNPVLAASDVPYDSALVFNAGVVRFNGRYVMVFRNDYGVSRQDMLDHYHGIRKDWPGFKTNIGLAFSDDGMNWEVRSEPCFELKDDEIRRAYDPRLTVIDGRCYMCFAIDTSHGIRGGIAVTDDFDKFEILSMSAPDNRNMVLFPEKINGNFVRLERPFPVYGKHGAEAFDIWIAQSRDCRFWGNINLLLGTENVAYANCKIGPAAPPVKTEKGWLTTFHGVNKVDGTEFDSWYPGWNKEYFAGLMLLDLDDPAKIIGMSKTPLMFPETEYEKKGFRGEVIFPGGIILEDSGEVKIYYGAADTVECFATAHIDDLLKLCIC